MPNQKLYSSEGILNPSKKISNPSEKKLNIFFSEISL
jgi:hypothetical protein